MPRTNTEPVVRIIFTPDEAREVAAACIRVAKRLARESGPSGEARILGTFGLELSALTRASVTEPGERLRAVE